VYMCMCVECVCGHAFNIICMHTHTVVCVCIHVLDVLIMYVCSDRIKKGSCCHIIFATEILK